jgi:hypothetical protein
MDYAVYTFSLHNITAVNINSSGVDYFSCLFIHVTGLHSGHLLSL